MNLLKTHILALSLVLCFVGSAFSSTLMPFKAYLTDASGDVVDATINIKFALVDDDTSTIVWTNDGSGLNPPTNAISSTVDEGNLALFLGDTSITNMTAIDSNLFSSANIKLRAWIEDSANPGTFVQLDNDKTLTASAYAHVAYRFEGTSLDGVSIGQSQAAAANITTLNVTASANVNGMLFPTTDGTAGQILITDGDGILSWQTPSGSAADLTLSNLSDASAARTNLGLTIGTDIQAFDANTAKLNAVATISADWDNTANPWSDDEVTNALTIEGGLINNTAIGTTNPSSANITTLTVTTSANLNGMVFPVADGASGTYLQTDGAGNLTWAAAAGGSSAAQDLSNLTGTPTDFQTNLGFGSMVQQSADSVEITGGNLSSVNIITASLGTETSDQLTINGTIVGVAGSSNVSIAGNLIPNAMTYTLGTKENPWNRIYAIDVLSTSDERFKKEIQPLEYGLDAVMQLNPVTYKWNNRPNHDGRTIGLLAQEVGEVVEEAVSVGDDAFKSQSVRYLNMVPILIKAIQEQQEIIEQYKQKVDLLEQNK